MSGGLERMPVLFVGHGSPMNAIEDNQFTREWEKLSGKIPRPKAILSISAHWYTKGTRVTDAVQPKTIYDMYGFPEELYQVKYQTEGSPELARQVKELIGEKVVVDNSWGCDHGTWSVLCRIYPKADIPVLQLSVDAGADARTQFEIGRQLSSLREEGVLILGSGNIVHNLSKVNWGMDGGYSWADEFDGYIRKNILDRKYEKVVNYKTAGKSSELAFFTPDHYYPLLYVLGASGQEDDIRVFNEACVLGSVSMTSYLFYR